LPEKHKKQITITPIYVAPLPEDESERNEIAIKRAVLDVLENAEAIKSYELIIRNIKTEQLKNLIPSDKQDIALAEEEFWAGQPEEAFFADVTYYPDNIINYYQKTKQDKIKPSKSTPSIEEPKVTNSSVSYDGRTYTPQQKNKDKHKLIINILDELRKKPANPARNIKGEAIPATTLATRIGLISSAQKFSENDKKRLNSFIKTINRGLSGNKIPVKIKRMRGKGIQMFIEI